MPISQIGRQIQSVSVSTTYSLTDPNIEQIVANATSAGFTITIFNDTNSGAYHRLVVRISASDSSGNSVTIVDANGNFSTALSSTSASVELETDPTGNWFIVAAYPTTDAATAISAADSAGLESSIADSTATSGGLAASSATSGITGLTTTVSTNKSIAASATLSGTSAAESIAASATLSGTSATASVATSQNTSQSTTISTNLSTTSSAVLSGVSATASVATSQNASQSLNVSTAQSTAAS